MSAVANLLARASETVRTALVVDMDNGVGRQ